MSEPAITSARTPRHALPYLFPGQAQKEAFVNEALARIDGLVQPSVIDQRAAPPAAPLAGNCHIVAPAATGAWSGRDAALATWAGSQWLFARPVAGALVFDAGSGCYAVFDDAEGWLRAPTPPLPAAGATQDAEARAAIAAIIDGLRILGLFA